MAEIVGIAASAVTLINVSRKISAGVSKVASLKHAPDILLALSNEIADLECVIVIVYLLVAPHAYTISLLTSSSRSSFLKLSDVARNLAMEDTA